MTYTVTLCEGTDILSAAIVTYSKQGPGSKLLCILCFSVIMCIYMMMLRWWKKQLVAERSLGLNLTSINISNLCIDDVN